MLYIPEEAFSGPVFPYLYRPLVRGARLPVCRASAAAAKWASHRFYHRPGNAHLTGTIIRAVIVRNDHYRYPLSYLLFMAAYTTLVFECGMPRWSSAYTADAWDAVAYFGGAFFYYFVHGRWTRYKAYA